MRPSCYRQLILDDRPQHLFNQNYHQILIKSELFTDIRYERMPEHDRMLELDKIVYPKGRTPKRGQISFVRINGRLVVFDTQFNDKYTVQYLKNGLLSGFHPSVYIKYAKDQRVLDALLCKLVVWAMFPCSWNVANSFEWSLNNTDRTIMASGVNSLEVMHRIDWFDKAKKLGINTYLSIPDVEYADLLKKSKWGVILSVRNEKNTREYEFISCHMPLALNYEPYYEFGFEPGRHYLKMNKVDDLELLLKTDPVPYHIESKKLWTNYFRPDVATRILLSHLD